jgi:hypothetical protein
MRLRKTPFDVDKPIISVLPLWKHTPANPVPIADILKRKGIEITKEDVWKALLDSNKVSNTEHWASLSVETKKKLNLPDPVVSALDRSPEVQLQVQQVQLQVQLQVLQRFSIKTVGEWQELSAETKKEIHDAGLPEAVINDLNKAVRVGLLLPSFKYAEQVAFLRGDKFWSIDEAKTLVQFADNLDDSWVLTREDCDATCNTYHKVAEWSIKLLLSRWNKWDDKHFRDPLHCVKIERFAEANKCVKHDFQVRYPQTHVLLTLVNKARAQTDFKETCAIPSLNRITTCAHTTYGGKSVQGDRIKCVEFYQHAIEVDKYLLPLYKFMQSTPMTKHGDVQKTHGKS